MPYIATVTADQEYRYTLSSPRGSSRSSLEAELARKLAKATGDSLSTSRTLASGAEIIWADGSYLTRPCKQTCFDFGEDILPSPGPGKAIGERALGSEARSKLADTDFALSGRRYPIHDRAHARVALARVSQYGTRDEKAEIKTKIRSRYPDMDMD